MISEMKLPDFKVAILCMTYQHASFIKDALDGFCMQQTSFPFIAAVVDDASTDGEKEVINHYLRDNFAVESKDAYVEDVEEGCYTFAQHKSNKNCYILSFNLKRNLFKQKGAKSRLIARWTAGAKYIAECEGDDYWTDPAKLQKQVDYMEEHEDCCMCTHSANWESQGSVYQYGCRYNFPCDLTTEEVIKNGGLYLATNSLVYRSWLRNDMPKWRKESSVGDFPLQILGTLRGKLHYLPETMSVYRFMREDSWTTKHFDQKETDTSVKYAKNKVFWFDLLDKDTNFQFTKTIYSYLFPSYNILFNAHEVSFSDYFRAAMKADEKHYGSVFKDFLIRYFKPCYKICLLFGVKKKDR